MDFRSRLRASFRAFMGGTAPDSAQGLLRSVYASGQAPRRGTKELLDAYRTLPWLHSVAHRLATDVARTPVTLYAPAKGKRGAEGKALTLKRQLRGAPHQVARQLTREALAAGTLRQVDTHPFLDLLSTMNPALRATSSLTATQLWLDLKGEAFWVLERDGMGKALEAWPIPPHWVAETPTASRPTFRVAQGAWNRQLPEADVVWFRNVDPLNPYGRGVGRAEALSTELDIDSYASAALASHFARGGMPAAVVGLPGAGEAELESFRERWLAQHEGPNKAGGIHFTNGEPVVEVFSQSLREQDMAVLRAAQRDTIIQVFNVPPEVIGLLENSNRATIDSAMYLYALGCLEPRLAMRDDGLQPLAEEWDESLVVGHVSTVPEDTERHAAHMVAVPTAFTFNEHRAMGGAERMDGPEGDELFQPPADAGAFGGGFEERSADPVWARQLRAIKAPGAKQVQNALEALRPETIQAEMDPLFKEQVDSWALDALKELGQEARFDILNPLILEHLAEFSGTRISGINDTTLAAVRDALTEGVAIGEDMDRLARRVRDVFEEATDVRSTIIARTEVMRSSNWATHEAHKASGVVDMKRWVATYDGRARDSHEALGRRAPIPLTEPFTWEDHKAMHPGGFGVAALDVQCRCTTVAVIEDVPEDPDFRSATAITKEGEPTAQEAKLEATWRAFVAKAEPWEEQAQAAMRRAFRKQEAAVLAALKS
jgi:SPP1 gp7 family putative phage head morphogenesis protein